MTWRIEPRIVAASDGGWGAAALMRGDAAAIARALRGHEDGSGIARARLPAVLRLGHGETADDLSILRFGLLLASADAHAAVEAVEPGRHRFWPLDSGDGPRFGLIVRAFGTALDEARCEVRVEPAVPELGLPRRAVLAGRAWADPGRLPDAHLWWDHGLSDPCLLCSDALAGRLAPLDMSGLTRCGP